MMIYVRAKPVRVRKRITRTGRDEKAFRFEASIGEWLIRMMPVIGEAALEAATNVREMREPAPVRRELITVRQAVADPNPLERQVGEGR